MEKPKLKLAFYEEWCCDAPAGCNKMYYLAWGDTYEELLWPVDEIHSHLEDDMSCSERGEGFDEMCAGKTPTREYLQSFGCDTGGVGCSCTLLEGPEIAPWALRMYRQHQRFPWDNDGGTDQDNFVTEALGAVEDDPEDYASVTELLTMVDDELHGRYYD